MSTSDSVLTLYMHTVIMKQSGIYAFKTLLMPSLKPFWIIYIHALPNHYPNA